jgi:hypothetical protein
MNEKDALKGLQHIATIATGIFGGPILPIITSAIGLAFDIAKLDKDPLQEIERIRQDLSFDSVDDKVNGYIDDKFPK